MSILTNFGKITNFRSIKVIPNVDSYGLILKKTFPSMISHEKTIRFTLFLHINGQNCEKSKIFQKLQKTITSEPNMLEMWYLCQNVQFWIRYRIPLIAQFRPKVDLCPFGTELFKCWIEPIWKVSLIGTKLGLWMKYGNLHMLLRSKVTNQGQRLFEVNL